jgi:hexosaminidase
MAASKLNVFHWHLVDWDSWPMQSHAYPLLWSIAWSPQERYSFSDVASIIEFGRARGIRVLLELDTPGHASSLCASYPDMCCDSPGCGWGPNSPLSPVPDAAGKNVSLDAILGLLTELAALSPDEFMHLGGDEAHPQCWNNTPSVRAWMQSMGYNSTNQVYGYFVAAADAHALALGKSPVRWQEVWDHFGTALDKRTVIHTWLSSAAIIEATSAGYRAIYSVDGQYYLDDLGETWEGFYNVDVLAGITNASAIPLVLGGETTMWGETVDASDLLATVFPRAAAAAERQWSYEVVSSSRDPYVLQRLQAFRCLLLERGLGAAPVGNAGARSAPAGPGSCAV